MPLLGKKINYTEYHFFRYPSLLPNDNEIRRGMNGMNDVYSERYKEGEVEEKENIKAHKIFHITQPLRLPRR